MAQPEMPDAPKTRAWFGTDSGEPIVRRECKIEIKIVSQQIQDDKRERSGRLETKGWKPSCRVSVVLGSPPWPKARDANVQCSSSQWPSRISSSPSVEAVVFPAPRHPRSGGVWLCLKRRGWWVS